MLLFWTALLYGRLLFATCAIGSRGWLIGGQRCVMASLRFTKRAFLRGLEISGPWRRFSYTCPAIDQVWGWLRASSPPSPFLPVRGSGGSLEHQGVSIPSTTPTTTTFTSTATAATSTTTTTTTASIAAALAVPTTTFVTDTPAAATFSSSDTGSTFHFLHVGKTGGTAIIEGLEAYVARNAITGAPRIVFHAHDPAIDLVKRRFVEKRPLPGDEGKIFFWLRAPVHRLTSAWISRYRRGLPAYYYPWSPGETEAFKMFPTPDDLFCALRSGDLHRRRLAASALGNVNHLNEPYSTYLGGAQTVLNMRDSIAFVGRTEHFPEDWIAMVNMLISAGALTQAPPMPPKVHATPVKYAKYKNLGKCSVDGLRAWYAEDYKLIQQLASLGVVSSSYPKEVEVLDAAPALGAIKSYF